jgi:hypothetical protein
MRISDDRYSRERQSLDLALRFLRHEARTQTIRTWTGLTDDRIRNLYRSYMSGSAYTLPTASWQVTPPTCLFPVLAGYADLKQAMAAGRSPEPDQERGRVRVAKISG